RLNCDRPRPDRAPLPAFSHLQGAILQTLVAILPIGARAQSAISRGATSLSLVRLNQLHLLLRSCRWHALMSTMDFVTSVVAANVETFFRSKGLWPRVDGSQGRRTAGRRHAACPLGSNRLGTPALRSVPGAEGRTSPSLARPL